MCNTFNSEIPQHRKLFLICENITEINKTIFQNNADIQI